MVDVGGKRELVRFEADSIPGSLEIAHEHLKETLQGGDLAALVFDGYMTAEGGERTDAFIVELIGSDDQSLGRILQAYRPARRFGLPIIGRRLAILGSPVVSAEIDGLDAEKDLSAGIREHPVAGRLFFG